MEPNSALSFFRVANDDLDNLERLNSAFEEDGYLYFRGILSRDEVIRVKRDFLGVLQRQGIARPGESEPYWTGAGLEAIDDDALYGLNSYADLVESEGMKRLMERVFGERVFLFKGTNIRYALPNDDAHVTPPHQDDFFIRGQDAFRTVWIPLMAIGRRVGGLALALGSHKQGLREHREQANVYSYQMKGRKQRGVALESIGEPWLTADYQPGDVLVFHRLMLHWALPNTSDRIRLSLDVRCQPEAAPRTWQSEATMLEQRRYRADVRRIATEEGASEALFEAVIIEMMKRGCKAERRQIQAIMAELSLSPA
jgi:hypothetical protein